MTVAGNTLPLLAVAGGSVACVKILAKQEACDCWNIPDQDGDTPIMYSIRVGSSDILKILLKCPRVDPNMKDADGDSPVIKAIREEKVTLARRLIKCPRVDLGVKDANGKSLRKIAR